MEQHSLVNIEIIIISEIIRVPLILVKSMEKDEECGKAFGMGSLLKGKTLSVVSKSCAQAHYSFSHELAHNFGAGHNIEAPDPASPIPYARGRLLGSSEFDKSYRTIMAVRNGEDNLIVANYFSNPNAMHRGTPTGIVNVSDNALVITQNRFLFADIGDESSTCQYAISSTTRKPSWGNPCSFLGDRKQRILIPSIPLI